MSARVVCYSSMKAHKNRTDDMWTCVVRYFIVQCIRFLSVSQTSVLFAVNVHSWPQTIISFNSSSSFSFKGNLIRVPKHLFDIQLACWSKSLTYSYGCAQSTGFLSEFLPLQNFLPRFELSSIIVLLHALFLYPFLKQGT